MITTYDTTPDRVRQVSSRSHLPRLSYSGDGPGVKQSMALSSVNAARSCHVPLVRNVPLTLLLEHS